MPPKGGSEYLERPDYQQVEPIPEKKGDDNDANGTFLNASEIYQAQPRGMRNQDRHGVKVENCDPAIREESERIKTKGSQEMAMEKLPG